MTDFHSSHPFAIWRVFQDAPRWWFARGCPPPLAAVDGWTRRLRAMVLLGVMGYAAGVVEVGICYGLMMKIGGLVFVLGGCLFGAIVMVPLSRWLGRSWWLSLLAIPVAGLVLGGALVKMYLFYGDAEQWVEEGVPYVESIAVGLVLSAWMTGGWRPANILQILLGGLIAGAALGLAGEIWQGVAPALGQWRFKFWWVELIIRIQAMGSWTALLAIAVGLRLVTKIGSAEQIFVPLARRASEGEFPPA